MDIHDVRNELNKGKTIYDLPLRVTFYARVSTSMDEQLHSLSAQVKYFSDFIKSNPKWEYVEGYIDEGISGTSVKKRESFLKMIDDAKLKKFDFIITKEISRFSRNTLDSIKYTQELLSYGVGVLFQSDNINTLFPDSELRLTIMSSIAQDEVRKTSERVKFGFKRAIDNGVVLGSNNIWGYRKDEGTLVIHEEEAEIVRLIFDMYANEGVGIRTICTRLSEMGYTNKKGNPFSFSTVRGILSNPKYKGYYCGSKTTKIDYKMNDIKYIDPDQWVMYKNEENVPPIVSEEIWDKANKILNNRSEKMRSEDKTSYQNKYAYSGKIICMEHNTTYYRTLFRYKSGNKEAWQCKIYSEKGKAGCTSPIIYTTELDMIMKNITNYLIKDKSKIIHDLIKMYTGLNTKSKLTEDIAKTQVQINDILKRKDKLLDLSINERISDEEFEIRNNKFNSEIVELNARIEDLENQKATNEDFGKTIDTLRELISNELDFEDGIEQNIVDALLDKIEVYKTNDSKVFDLKVYLKVTDESIGYNVNRKTKGKASVCSASYT